MPDLRLTCFGNLQIELNGKVLTGFDTDKTRALLVYLAIENRHPQRRSHLAGLLWSDQSDEQALHCLRQALLNLRKVCAQALPDVPLLLSERDQLQINPAITVWVDVLAFRADIAAASQHYQQRDQARWLNARRLQAAIDLVQGQFMAQFALKGSPLFDEWAAVEREDLNQQAAEMLAVLAEVYERRGAYASARKMAQRILDILPWDENAHLQVMRLYAVDGQWSAAQNQYALLRKVLWEQLGVQPAAQTSHLFEQIRTAGLRGERIAPCFAPAVHGLPPANAPFVGRQAQLDEIADYLADPNCRLLTILGPGGIGKTSLALEAAREQVGLLRDGVFFVSLLNVTEAEQVVSAIADAVGLSLSEQNDPRARLHDYLREKRLLLLLDNYEQLLAQPNGSQPVVDILEYAPGVLLMVTSRERLLLQEEWLLPLAGLDCPRDAADPQAERYDALALFARRAQQVQPSFSLAAWLAPVIQICQIVEGLPLGIELAAAASWSQNCAQIAESLRARFDALSAANVNHSVRHRSLRAAFDTSWQLLNPAEQDLYCHLAIFEGGFGLSAARQVAQASPAMLTDLVNQSLVRCDAGGRYSLHEILRQYALEKLAEADSFNAARASHAAFYSAFLAEQEVLLQGRAQKEALANLQIELGNARLAWNWLLEDHQMGALCVCTDSLHTFFLIRSRFQEGIALFQTALAPLEAAISDGAISDGAISDGAISDGAILEAAKSALGCVLARIGSLAYYARENGLAFETTQRAYAIFIDMQQPTQLAFCRFVLSGIYLRRKDFENALACAQDNLLASQQVMDCQGEARALYMLGLIDNRLGRFGTSKTYLNAAIAAGRQQENARRLIAPLNLLGDLACVEGDYTQAERLFTESLALCRELQDVYYQAIVLNNLATIYHYVAQYPQASAAYQESLSLCHQIGDRDGEAIALNNLGELAVVQGDFEAGFRYSEQALKIARQIEEEWSIVVCLNNLGEASYGVGRCTQSLAYLSEAIRIAWSIEALELVVRCALNAGRCYHLQGRVQAANQLYSAVVAHSATAHDTRTRAQQWLIAQNIPGEVESSDRLLEITLRQLGLIEP